MKSRSGFVSNSSSCSFICQLCEKRVEGNDWDEPSERGLGRCVNGHLLCREHFSVKRAKVDWDNVPAKFCPLCRLGLGSPTEYLLKKTGMTMEEVVEEMTKIEDTTRVRK